MARHSRVYTKSPSLKARVRVLVPLKDLERDALFAKALGQAEPTNAATDDEDVHLASEWMMQVEVWKVWCETGCNGRVCE